MSALANVVDMVAKIADCCDDGALRRLVEGTPAYAELVDEEVSYQGKEGRKRWNELGDTIAETWERAIARVDSWLSWQGDFSTSDLDAETVWDRVGAEPIEIRFADATLPDRARLHPRRHRGRAGGGVPRQRGQRRGLHRGRRPRQYCRAAEEHDLVQLEWWSELAEVEDDAVFAPGLDAHYDLRKPNCPRRRAAARAGRVLRPRPGHSPCWTDRTSTATTGATSSTRCAPACNCRTEPATAARRAASVPASRAEEPAMRAVVVVTISALLALPVAGMGTAAAAAAHPFKTSGNLIKNGNAEAGSGSSDGSTVPVPKWTLTTGTTFTAVQYGASGGFPTSTDPGPAKRGLNFFAGGSGEDEEVATQTIALKSYAAAIDAGTATAKVSAYLGGFASQEDNALLEIDWKSKAGSVLGSIVVGPVSAEDRGDVTGLLQRKGSGTIPVGARTAFVQLALSRASGSYNDGYADNLSLTVTVPS